MIPLPSLVLACTPEPPPVERYEPPVETVDYATVPPVPPDTVEETGTEPETTEPPPADTTDASAYTGPPRVVYGTGEFFFGSWVVLDPADRSEVFRTETSGTTLVGCSGPYLGALISSFSESGLKVVDPDGGPVAQRTWSNLTFPSAFAAVGPDLVLADEGRAALSVLDTAGAPVASLSLAPVADGDGMAEPRWLVQADDGALYMGVDRYNQLIGGPGGGPNGGAAIAVIEPGADRASEAWPIGTPLITSPHVVAHGGRLWVGSLGNVTAAGELLFDGGLLSFDLASRTLSRVVEGTAMNHVVARRDGGGVWVTEVLSDDDMRIVAVDWDGTRGATLPVGAWPTGLGEDLDGNLWVADENGVRVVDPVSGAVVAPVAEGLVGSLRVCR